MGSQKASGVQTCHEASIGPSARIIPGACLPCSTIRTPRGARHHVISLSFSLAMSIFGRPLFGAAV